MGLLQGVKNFFVGEDEIEQDDYEPVYENENDNDNDEEESSSENYSNYNDMNQGGNRKMKIEQSQTLQIVLARPKDFSEVKSRGDDLKAQKTVLLNLELVKSEDASRILDFLSGVAYAKDADIKMMATKTFAIMPPNVGFEGVDLMNELENNGYSF